MKRLLKILSSFVIVIIFLMFFLVIILQTEHFKNWLKQTLIRQWQQTAAGQLHLGRLSGGLMSGFDCEDFLWTADSDTILTVKRLKLHLRPLHLLNKTVYIDRLEIESPRLLLHQTTEGTWNVSRKEKNRAHSPSSHWQLQLKSLQLTNGKVSVSMVQPQLSAQVVAIDLEMMLHYLNGWTIGRIFQCRGQWQDHSFAVQSLTGFFTASAESLSFRKMKLTTTRSDVAFDVHIGRQPSPSFRLSLKSDTFDFMDVRAFWPPFPSSKSICLQAAATLSADSLQWRLHAAQGHQSLIIDGSCHPFARDGRIRLNIYPDRLDIRDWIDRPDIAMQLNGQLTMAGRGFDPSTADWQIVAQLLDSRIAQTEIAQADIQAILQRNWLQTKIQLSGVWGQTQIQGSIDSLSTQPQYDLTVDCHHLNLAKMLPQTDLVSDLSFTVKVDGVGYDPAATPLRFGLSGANSSLFNLPLTKILATGRWQRREFTLDSLIISSAFGQLQVHGVRRPSGWLDFTFRGQIADSTYLKHHLNKHKVGALGYFTGRLAGIVDSLDTSGTLTLRNASYEKLSLKKLQGQWQISGLGSAAHGVAQVDLADMHIEPAFHLQAASMNARIFKDFVFLQSHLDIADSLWTDMRTELRHYDSTFSCLVTDLQVRYKNQHWSGGSDSTVVRLYPSGLQVKNLYLNFQDQSIALNGEFGHAAAGGMVFYGKNILLNAYTDLFPANWRLAGAVDWELDLQGTSTTPQIASKGIWRNGRLGAFTFDSLAAIISYDDELLHTLLQLTDKKTQPLIVMGDLPLTLSLDPPSFTVHYDRPVQVQLRFQDMPLSFFSAFVPDLLTNSSVSGLVALQQNLDHPQPSGSLIIHGDKIDSPALGKPLRNISMRAEVDTSAIWLRECSVKGGDGILKGQGFIAYDLHHLTQPFRAFYVRLQPHGFTPIDLPELSLTLDGDLVIEKKNQTAVFAGGLTIDRARFDLAALLQTPTTIMLPDRPLLVVSQEDSLSQAYDASVLAPSWFKYFSNLRGAIKIEAPRNTWLRSREMNIEISGSLDLVKQSSRVELFGSIRILRGTYDLYSRKFDIQSGSLTFLGGEKFNPLINLEAEYLFRSADRMKKTLKLTVGGELFKPTMKFSLDGLEITETDAIAYLLFGRSFDLLTQGEKNHLQQGQPPSDMSSEAMKQLLSWQIAGQLSNSLRQQLKLDVIEFRGDQNWRQATVVVGKYLTNDLYISYEREFDFSRSNAAVPEQVTLEYEILRSLHLQATHGDERRTGFDIIWKFEK